MENNEFMPSEEYISLTLLAMASLGVIVANPFFVEGMLIISVVLIALWKKIYDTILTKLKIQYISTTIILCSVIILGVIYLFKGEAWFIILGLVYLISSFFAFKNHIEIIHEST